MAPFPFFFHHYPSYRPKIFVVNYVFQFLPDTNDFVYKNSSVEGKRYLVSCIFPEKMEYDGDRYRTLLANEITEHIYLKNK